MLNKEEHEFTKEEIGICKEYILDCLTKKDWEYRAFYLAMNGKTLIDYIEQLENKVKEQEESKQAIADKLKETMQELKDDGYDYYANEVNKILKMLEEKKRMEVKELYSKLKEGHAVCFDFDGVIHKYSKGWQDGSIYDEYNKEVLDLMLLLQKAGIPVYICSARNLIQIISWWNKQGFWTKAQYIGNDEQFWNDLKFIGVTNRKLPAQLYIDDRAYKYEGQTVKQFILDN